MEVEGQRILWLGEKTMKPQAKELILHVASLVGLTAFALGGYFAVTGLVGSMLAGHFETWQRLTVPPAKGERFLVERNDLCVETQAGEVWGYASGKWEARPAGASRGAPAKPQYPCHFVLPPFPGKVLDRYDASDCYEFSYSQTTYVLLADGTIWRWQHSADLGGSIILIWGAMACGPVAGFMLGVAVMELVWRKLMAKSPPPPVEKKAPAL